MFHLQPFCCGGAGCFGFVGPNISIPSYITFIRYIIVSVPIVLTGKICGYACPPMWMMYVYAHTYIIDQIYSGIYVKDILYDIGARVNSAYQRVLYLG